MRNDFIAFILTHGRPDKQVTFQSLKRHGYTGDICMLIDNEDAKGNEYKKKYGDIVRVFDKKAISKTFDEYDTFNNRKAIVYARNACWEIAREMGKKYFIQLDDDYTCFSYKCDEKCNYVDLLNIKNLDAVFNSMIEFLDRTQAATICMSQGGDFLGGKNGGSTKIMKLARKAMNTFVCDADRPFQFLGRINEDVNTYVLHGGRGMLFLTVPNIGITQMTTQKNKGGMTDIYLDNGTYVKSFYTVLSCPSCVKIAIMQSKNRRIHHSIKWNNAVPRIISQEYKK